ncbi:UIMC1 protein, partial [Atractosteus spatula]|nr:UIMC1 protein [Atractosteus spatula]
MVSSKECPSCRAERGELPLTCASALRGDMQGLEEDEARERQTPADLRGPWTALRAQAAVVVNPAPGYRSTLQSTCPQGALCNAERLGCTAGNSRSHSFIVPEFGKACMSPAKSTSREKRRLLLEQQERKKKTKLRAARAFTGLNCAVNSHLASQAANVVIEGCIKPFSDANSPARHHGLCSGQNVLHNARVMKPEYRVKQSISGQEAATSRKKSQEAGITCARCAPFVQFQGSLAAAHPRESDTLVFRGGLSPLSPILQLAGQCEESCQSMVSTATGKPAGIPREDFLAPESSRCDDPDQTSSFEEREEFAAQKTVSKRKENSRHEPCRSSESQSDPGFRSGKSTLGRTPVLLLKKLSPDVLRSCQESGCVIFSQRLPVTPTPSQASGPPPPLTWSPAVPERSLQCPRWKLVLPVWESAEGKGARSGGISPVTPVGTVERMRQGSLQSHSPFIESTGSDLWSKKKRRPTRKKCPNSQSRQVKEGQNEFPELQDGSSSDSESLLRTLHKPVLRLEKLSQEVVGSCKETGFVLCSQDHVPSESSQSSPGLSPPLPESPVFSKGGAGGRPTAPSVSTRRRQILQGSEQADGGAGGQENLEELPSCSLDLGDKEVSKRRLSTRRKGSFNSPAQNRRPQADEEERCTEEIAEGQLKQRGREQQSRLQTPNKDELPTCSVKLNDGFPSQMTLHWAEEEDENEEEDPKKENQERHKTDQTHVSQKNALLEDASSSESETRLKTFSCAPCKSGNATDCGVLEQEERSRQSQELAGSFRESRFLLRTQETRAPDPRQSPRLPKRGPGDEGTAPGAESGGNCLPGKFLVPDTGAAAAAGGRDPGALIEKSSSVAGSPAVEGGSPSRPASSLRDGPQQEPGKRGPDQAAVLYYWGVPFCPKGLDPDEYTQVILTQMDVYQRSLKAAQRGLLRKAEWGDPVLPAPTEEPPCKKRRRLRRNENDPQDGEGGMNDAEKEEQEVRGGLSFGQVVFCKPPESCLFFFKSVKCKIKRKKSKTNHSGTGERSHRKRLFLSVLSSFSFNRRRGLRESSPPEAAQPREEEPELDVCPETQLCDEGTQQLSSERPASFQPQPVVVVVVEEEEEEEEGSAAADEGVTEKETPAEHVQCPICMQSFPLLRIEVHAAYCDGPREEELLEEAASQAGRTCTLQEQQSAYPGPINLMSVYLLCYFLCLLSCCCSSLCRSTSREKCYICRGYVPVGDFERHTESCIRRRGREDFLTALEQSEQKNIGKPAFFPAWRKRPAKTIAFIQNANEPVSLLDHEDDAAGEDQVPSDSPVRAFTPISEAKDCLVDFKQQFASRTGQRAGKRRRLKR